MSGRKPFSSDFQIHLNRSNLFSSKGYEIFRLFESQHFFIIYLLLFFFYAGTFWMYSFPKSENFHQGLVNFLSLSSIVFLHHDNII
jgi:hypothetical protein